MTVDRLQASAKPLAALDPDHLRALSDALAMGYPAEFGAVVAGECAPAAVVILPVPGGLKVKRSTGEHVGPFASLEAALAAVADAISGDMNP